MLRLSARWRWVTNAMFWSLYPLERVPVPTLGENELASGPVWADMAISLEPVCIVHSVDFYNV